jgi:hypothetical protein
MQLKRLVLASILATAAIAPTPAAAEGPDCVTDAVNECNRDFPPSDYWNISIRGWCYITRVGLCKAGY